MSNQVPPVDPDQFQFAFTLAMESVKQDGSSLEFAIGRITDDAIKQRFMACGRAICWFEDFPERAIFDLQMKAVHLAATFPLKEGEDFDRELFVANILESL